MTKPAKVSENDANEAGQQAAKQWFVSPSGYPEIDTLSSTDVHELLEYVDKAGSDDLTEGTEFSERRYVDDDLDIAWCDGFLFGVRSLLHDAWITAFDREKR